jgi:hypothetical protein
MGFNQIQFSPPYHFIEISDATGAGPTRPLAAVVALHSQRIAIVVHSVQRVCIKCALVDKTKVRIAKLLVAYLHAGTVVLGVAAQVECESRSCKLYITLQLLALSSSRFQLGFLRVNLHRPTSACSGHTAL